MERAFANRFFEMGSSSSRLTPEPTQPIFPIENISKTLLQGSDFSVGSSLFGLPTVLPPDLLFLESSSFGYFLGDPPPPPLQLKHVPESAKAIRFGSDCLKSPKLEEAEEYNEIPTVHPVLECPPLPSYPIDGYDLSTEGSIQKRPRTLSPPNDGLMIVPYTVLGDPPLDQSNSPEGDYLPLVGTEASRAPVYPRCTLARRRRKRLSDRTRALELLMPWERKIDTATLLEEAHKYVRFLEAQVSALEGMPVRSGLAPSGPNRIWGEGFGGLERLNRQQMLQVLMNSARVQEKLYASGCCVFSFEQMMDLKELAEKKMVVSMFE